MRSLLATCALAACILNVHALQLREKRDGETPKVVQHQIRRRHVTDPVKRDLARQRRRRSGTVTGSLVNEETLYYMQVTMGTPAQTLDLHIDTGSSDLWVNVAGSQLCSESGSPCAQSGTYSANSSSTYKYLNSDFNISYVDGSGASGDYVSDVVRFSGVTLDSQVFGIGYTSSSQEGILGIGYPENEVAVSDGFKPYNNVPGSLVADGYINTNAYSLWLDDLEASTGQILFGGVNTAKYTGQLQSLPVIKTQGVVYADFIIGLTAVGVDGNEGSIASNQKLPALLDSGTSLMYLPNGIVNDIYKEFNATYDNDFGAGAVDCSLSSSSRTIDFTFSSPTISVALSEIVLQADSNTCIIGIGYSGDSTLVLGDTFIRSAYIVYDLDNNEIALAQTDFSSNSDNIVEITSSGIPDATTVQGAVTSAVQATGGAILGASGSSNAAAAAPTAALGYNLALLGAAGAAILAL